MNFYAGHDYFLQYQTDAAAITESLTTTAATIAALAGTYVDIGYTSPGAITRTTGNGIGYASGRRKGSYRKKGMRRNSMAADIRIGSHTFIETVCLAATPPYIALRWGIDNSWANQLRKAVVASTTLNFNEGEGQEIIANARFEALVREDDVTAPDISYGFEQFGSVLFWHNVRNLTIGGATGGAAVSSMREKLAGLTVTADDAVEYKPNYRNDWGDQYPMSRTAYALMVHHKTVTGSLKFHDKVAAAYFTSTVNSTYWGNLVISCSDTAIGGTKIFDTTISEIVPTSEVQDSVDSNGELTWSVDFAAADVSVATV